MESRNTVGVGCILVASIPVIPIILLAIVNLLAISTPIDDPLFQKQPLAHWLVQVESDNPAERLEATKILADIVLHGASMPMSCRPLGGLTPSFRREVRIAEHHNEVISRHVEQIFAALERTACADDPPNNLEALRGLSHIGMWAGEDEQLRVLPLLIADFRRGFANDNSGIQDFKIPANFMFLSTKMP